MKKVGSLCVCWKKRGKVNKKKEKKGRKKDVGLKIIGFERENRIPGNPNFPSQKSRSFPQNKRKGSLGERIR